MVNVLLITKDMKYCKKLINSICKENKNLRISIIANTLKEIKDSLNNYNIDIIIINLKSTDYNKIDSKRIISETRYKKSVILIQEDNYDKINRKNIYNCFEKNDDMNKIVNTLNQLAIEKANNIIVNKNTVEEKIIKEEIKKELEYLGYNFAHNGTKYIIEVIYILYFITSYGDDNLEKDIYPIVGKKYGKSAHNIKCNITNSTETMTFECEEERLKNYLYDYKYIKPGPKRIIYAILGKLNK